MHKVKYKVMHNLVRRNVKGYQPQLLCGLPVNVILHLAVMKVAWWRWWRLRVYKWRWNPRARLLYPAAFLNERSSWGRCLSRCAELWTSRAIWSSSTPLSNTTLYGAQNQECNRVRDTESLHAYRNHMRRIRRIYH